MTNLLIARPDEVALEVWEAEFSFVGLLHKTNELPLVGMISIILWLS